LVTVQSKSALSFLSPNGDQQGCPEHNTTPPLL
jgi:hypothetical protein